MLEITFRTKAISKVSDPEVTKVFSQMWKNLTDEWLSKSQAVVLFSLCSVLTLALIPVFLGRIHGHEGSLLFQTFWGSLGLLGAPATLFLWVGMWRYWAHVDNSRKWTKRFWFIVLLLGFWYGSVLYCYFAYLPQRLGVKEH
jgi:hypothetical protein